MGTAPARQLTQSQIELLWKQFDLQISLLKHYLDLVLKFNVFYYASTGALVSYYFSKPEIELMKYSLLFPVLMSLGFASVFIYGTTQISWVRKELYGIRDALGLGTAPEYHILTASLVVSAILMVPVALAMLYIVIFVQLPVAKK